jgi:SdrD B-like domain
MNQEPFGSARYWYTRQSGNLLSGVNRLLNLLILWLVLLGSTAVAQVSGTVFRDYNRDGQQASGGAKEPGVTGLVVLAYVEGINQPLSTSTDQDGNFIFSASVVASGKKVRLEFTPETTLFVYDAPAITGSSVQFVQAPTSTVLYGVSDPADYCHASPQLALPVYYQGAIQASNNALVTFAATASGQLTNPATQPSPVGKGTDMGAVWASAWQRQSGKLVSLSLLKRHADLGPLGLGGIYLTDPTTATSTAYFDAGQYLTLASTADLSALSARTLPQSFSVASVDGAAFSLVGKVGFGGATFTPREDRLWVINAYERTLVSVAVGSPMKSAALITPALFTSYPVPQTNTAKGENRPWAVTYYQGKLYVGMVNDASKSHLRADLQACVYAFDLATNTFDPTPVLTVPLTYRKGWATVGTPSLGEYWEPWSDNWADFATNTLNATTTPVLNRVVRPQPILSSISFDAEGAMILGFMDRTGHQTGRNQPAPTETAPTPLTVYSGYPGGDLLRAALVDGTYYLEIDGSAGTNSGSGTMNGQGPGDPTFPADIGGEFYSNDTYSTQNEETFTGSLISNGSIGDLYVTLYNPLTTWSGGTAVFDLYTGQVNRRYEIYSDPSSTTTSPLYTGPRSTFGVANGTGQLTPLCEATSSEIGNRAWIDTNANGVQDPAEAPLPGLTVAIYTASGQYVASTTTDQNGLYRFKTGNGLNLALNTPYYIVVGYGQKNLQFQPTNKSLVVGIRAYGLTGWNLGTGPNADLNDSDTFLLSGTNTTLDGLPVMPFVLTVPGQTINGLDIGMQDIGPCGISTVCLPITGRRIR